MFNAILSPFDTALRLTKRLLSRYRNATGPLLERALPPHNVLNKLPFIGQKISTLADANALLSTTAKRIITAEPSVRNNEYLAYGGDRETHARAILPPSEYPELWYHVPDDMKRPVIEDGYCINGETPAVALAGNVVTNEFIAECHADAISTATFWGVTAFAALAIVQTLILIFINANSHAPDLTSSHTSIATLGWDIWPGEVSPGASLNEKVRSVSAVVKGAFITINFLVVFALSALAIAIFSAGVSVTIWWSRFAGLINVGIGEATAVLRTFEYEAKQRHRHRLEQNMVERDAYRNALKAIESFDSSPLLNIGSALGVLGFRGKLGSPMPGQEVQMSMIDLLQHMLVLGSSGEGKTRNLLRVLMSQLANYRKQGYPISIFAMDDKSVLHHDLTNIAKQFDIDNLRIIGVAPGEFQVDLLDGTPPSAVADIIDACAMTMAGEAGKGDAFWSQMSSQLVLEIATILQTWELTNKGREWVRREGYRAYSLRNILRVCQSDKITLTLIEQINDAILDDSQYVVIQHTVGLGLWSAIEAQLTAWAELATSTKSGVLASTRATLRLFAFSEIISKGFGDGAGKHLLSPKDLQSNFFTAVAISAVEHGSAGRLVLIALKSLYQRHARAADARDPTASDNRLKWWGNPNLSTASDSPQIHVFIVDEYQGLATREDEHFVAVARSSGTCMVLSTQSLSAIEATLGKTSTSALINNLRSKLFLRTEDPETIAYAVKLAGKTIRQVNKLEHFVESYRGAVLQWKLDVENLEKASLNRLRSIANIQSLNAFDSKMLFESLKASSIEVARWGNLVAFGGLLGVPSDMQIASNDRWLENVGDQQMDTLTQIRQSRERIQWGRYSDAEYVDANEKPASWAIEDALGSTDFVEMGRSRAQAFIQRSGINRNDTIQLNAPLEFEDLEQLQD